MTTLKKMTMTIIDELKAAIIAADKQLVLSKLEELKNLMLADDELSMVIVQPATITELHTLLIEHMGVNPRAMRLNVRVPSLRKRAFLFVQTMTNGVNYLQ